MIETQKERILFLLHIPPPVHGSSVVGKSIFESRLINDSFDCRYINLLASQHVADSGKINTGKLLSFIHIWIKLIIEIINRKPDICYLALTATGKAFYRDVALVALLRLCRIRRVYHMHNKGVKLYRKRKINHRLYRFVFQDADVILLSDLLYHDVDCFVPASRIHICPNGIRKSNTEHIPQKNQVVQLLFLSNLIESKGVFVLLDACKILKNKGLLFQCSFAGSEGDISRQQFNQEVKKRHLEKNVNYLGRKYDECKDRVFAEADIFVLPTFYYCECYPLVLLEALSYGLPVVSTFEGGIPDIIEDGISGVLCPQQDAEALAEKLSLLICDKEIRENMGKKGHDLYEQKFTLDIFEKRLLLILENLIQKNKKRL